MSNHCIHILYQMDWFMRNQPWFHHGLSASASSPGRTHGILWKEPGENHGKTMFASKKEDITRIFVFFDDEIRWISSIISCLPEIRDLWWVYCHQIGGKLSLQASNCGYLISRIWLGVSNEYILRITVRWRNAHWTSGQTNQTVNDGKHGLETGPETMPRKTAEVQPLAKISWFMNPINDSCNMLQLLQSLS